MADFTIQSPDDGTQLVRALSRWDNEGGAGDDGPQVDTAVRLAQPEPAMLVLQLRLMTLEELVVALLAAGTDQAMLVAQRLAERQVTAGALPSAAYLRDLVGRASRRQAGKA